MNDANIEKRPMTYQQNTPSAFELILKKYF